MAKTEEGKKKVYVKERTNSDGSTTRAHYRSTPVTSGGPSGTKNSSGSSGKSTDESSSSKKTSSDSKSSKK